MDILVPLLDQLIMLSDSWHNMEEYNYDQMADLDTLIVSFLGDQALATLGATRMGRMIYRG